MTASPGQPAPAPAPAPADADADADADAASTDTPRHEPTRGLYGWITHTELSSADPAATKAWCTSVLGWSFMPSVPMPDGGEYHLFAYSEQGGGGIRRTNPPETPGTIPYVHVPDTQAAYDAALREGAEAMFPPTRVMEGVTVAVVRAPGGVPIGFSGP
ncbi:MAG TPA: VOC family protein [Gemmatimonadaceae bacterium]|nr:VOC family protein [Gemmatimonadaceae bacterium]